MTHLSSFNRSFNPVAKARRHHRHLMRKDPSLASAISGAGMVLPDGSVALALSDGDIALYEVHVIVRHYCRPARSRGPVVEMALDEVAYFDACVRGATKFNSDFFGRIAASPATILNIAAE